MLLPNFLVIQFFYFVGNPGGLIMNYECGNDTIQFICGVVIYNTKKNTHIAIAPDIHRIMNYEQLIRLQRNDFNGSHCLEK